MTPLQQARSLARGGNVATAIEILWRGAESGHADCLVDLGFIYLQGTRAPRDLLKSRECFARASELGNSDAQKIHTCFLAVGVGGPRDFLRALEQLRQAVRSDPKSARELQLLDKMKITEAGDPIDIPEPKQLSDTPALFLFPSLLTPDECNFLIDAAQPAFRPAHVGATATGRQAYSNVRTCEFAAFSWVAESPAVHALNRRIAAASKTAAECGEPLQVLRYRGGQEFKRHYDCTEATDNQRILTMLVYLNDDYTGGETLFVKTGLKVRGRIGDGLLFRNARDDGSPDKDSLHAGLPVSSGEKLIASRWIRQKRFGPA